MRADGRANDQLREVKLTRQFTCHAEGSVLVEFGRTRVICTASYDATVPGFLKGQGRGWVTAEYGMLPRSTGQRMRREASSNRQGGRTLEIQRLIGRSLRAVVDSKALGECSFIVDCDVIQADGGTRTAAITGSYVALVDAIRATRQRGQISTDPLTGKVASVSVGVVDGTPMLDLDYGEDSRAQTDMNVVMNERGQFIEIQGTAEGHPFDRAELGSLLDLAAGGIASLLDMQSRALDSA